MGCSYSRGTKTPRDPVSADQLEYALGGFTRRRLDYDIDDDDVSLPYAHLHKDELPGGGFDVEEDDDSAACVLKRRVQEDYKKRQKEFRRAMREEAKKNGNTADDKDRVTGGLGLSSIFNNTLGSVNRPGGDGDTRSRQEMADRQFAEELDEQFQLDDLQEITDARRNYQVPEGDSERKNIVQDRLFSVFDREESKYRQRSRLDKFKKNQKEELERRNMIGIRAPGLAIANLETTATSSSPTSSSGKGFSPRSRRNSGSSDRSSSVGDSNVKIDKKALQEMINMGFDEAICKKGLIRCKNDKTLAVEYIMSKLAKDGQLMADISPLTKTRKSYDGDRERTSLPPNCIAGEVSWLRPRSASRVNFDDNVTEYSADTYTSIS